MKNWTATFILMILVLSQSTLALAESNSNPQNEINPIASLLNLNNPEQQAIEIYQFLSLQNSDSLLSIFEKYHFPNELQFRIVSLAFHRKNFKLLTDFKKSGFSFLTMDTNKPLICEMMARMNPEYNTDLVVDELLHFKDHLDNAELEEDCDGNNFQQTVTTIKSQRTEFMLSINSRLEWASQEREELKSISESVSAAVVNNDQSSQVIQMGQSKFSLYLERSPQCSTKSIQIIQDRISNLILRFYRNKMPHSQIHESNDSTLDGCDHFFKIQRIL